MISEYFNIDKLHNDIHDFTEDDLKSLKEQSLMIMRIINSVEMILDNKRYLKELQKKINNNEGEQND